MKEANLPLNLKNVTDMVEHQMDIAKTTIGPIPVRTLVMAVVGLAALEIFFRAVSWHETRSSLLVLALARFFEGVWIIGILFFGKQGLSVFGISRTTAISGFRRGLLWSAGFLGAVLLVFVSLAAMGIDPIPFIRTPVPKNAVALVLFFLVGGVVAPITEELFFRGVLYGFLRRWGTLRAVVLSSLAFTWAHETGFTGLALIQLTGGVLFAVAYEVEKNLMVPVTLHILGNLTIFVLSLPNA